jgi:hypothetical protein
MLMATTPIQIATMPTNVHTIQDRSAVSIGCCLA